MYRYNLFICCLLFLLPGLAHAQAEKRWLKHQISILTEPTMQGRGYVNNGHDKAAKYVLRKFREIGLQPVNKDSTYIQYYFFPVNTFPDVVALTLNKKDLSSGDDFLIDAASQSYSATRMKVKKMDLAAISDSAQWDKTKKNLRTDKRIYYLEHTDSLAKVMHTSPWRIGKLLPHGCYIIPEHGKLTWTVATDTVPATVFYVEDSVMPRHLRKASVLVHNVMLPEGKNKNANIIGCVPGTTAKDSFIVFSAHYDHLGRMGDGAYFPGASDNASGTAMLLYLANYFAKNPQRYTIVFIAFSGEEAGLKGSGFFVKHPMIPLDNIRFLTNLDIMGDASNGVTVVNATEFPAQFNLLKDINARKGYLPEIKSRGKAANSDHYYFTEAGVPSFFMYTNGGIGYYHDVFDNARSLSLTNIPEVAKLLIDFTKSLNEQ